MQLTWAQIASLTDSDAYIYFQKAKGQDNMHASASLKTLRRMYGGTDKKAPQPLPVGFTLELVTLEKSDERGEPFTPPVPEVNAPKPTPMVPNNAGDPWAVMAASIAPHLMSAIQSHVDAAIELVAQQAKAPVLQIHVRDEAPRVLEGLHHAMMPEVLRLSTQRQRNGQLLNVMMKGPAGSGKTTIAKSIGKALERKATVISCSAGMSEAQLFGRLLPLGAGGAFKYVESPFVKAYRTGGVILLDEVDGADSNLMLALNAAVDNGGIEIEARAANELDTLVTRHPETIILAGANTFGTGPDTVYVGRNALDGAFLNRFYPVEIGYDAAIEEQCGTPAVVARVQTIRLKAEQAKIRRIVSTRMILQMDAAITAGATLEHATSQLLASWSRDERAKVGH